MSKSDAISHRSGCPLASTLDFFGDKWSLLVVRDLIYFETRTFKEFEQSWEGFPASTLADRLSKLEALDIIQKKPYQARPVRYQYSLTDKGLTLVPVLKAMAMWGQEHISSAVDVVKVSGGVETLIPPEGVSLASIEARKIS